MYSGKITIEQLREIRPVFVISYNYRYIIEENIIQYMKGKIINLHISFLPWNKGADPNIWSFIMNTPKGVTIHLMEKGLDSGDILIQKQVWFDESRETFETTYEVLNDFILMLLKQNWKDLVNGSLKAIPQKKEIGSYHTKKDLKKFLNGRTMDWSENIKKFKQRMKVIS